MAKLNTASSVVDFLKSKGEESSFTARKRRFNELGLNKRLGDFVGSGSQNLALLRQLQTPSVEGSAQSSIPNIDDTVSGARDTLRALRGASKRGAGDVDIANLPSDFNIEDLGKTPVAGQRVDLPEIPEAPVVTADEILRRARGETNVQIAEQQRDVEKARVDQALPGQIESVAQDFASRGLAFSGLRNEAEQAVRDQALADKLDLDISFAKILGNAIDTAESDLNKEFAEIVKEAEENRKDAIAQLNQLGFAVVDGRLYPTLSAQREMRLAESASKPSFEIRSLPRGGLVQIEKDASGRVIGQTVIRTQEPKDTEEQPIGIDEFTKLLSNETRTSYHPDTVEKLYSEYVTEFTTSEIGFSKEQKLKLVQAGLADATAQEKLDFLFGQTAVIDPEVINRAIQASLGEQ